MVCDRHSQAAYFVRLHARVWRSTTSKGQAHWFTPVVTWCPSDHPCSVFACSVVDGGPLFSALRLLVSTVAAALDYLSYFVDLWIQWKVPKRFKHRL